jgi:glycerol-3-phosphate acyltransferase PlsY
MSTLQIILFLPMLALAYLIGSIPFGVVIGKLFFGVDIRRHGSGNVGTTNAFRVLGKKAGVAVLICDMLKGYVPALAASLLFGPWATIFIASAPVAGHMYSIFLRGSGGKGIATGSAVALALAPQIYIVVLAIWVAVLLVTRIVSLASLTAATLLAVLTIVEHEPLPYQVAVVIVLVLVVWAHRSNILRLAQRREPRVTFPWNKPPAVAGPHPGKGH